MGDIAGWVGIPSEYVVPGGAVTLLSAAVMLILSGRLVPRATLLLIQAGGNDWREAYLKECEAHAETRAQLAEAIKHGDLTNTLLTSLKSARDSDSSEGTGETW